MIKILNKINEAIELIKKQNLNKQGRNSFSNYNYYTPEQVSELVMGACHIVKILPKFDLTRDNNGKITGKLEIFNLEEDSDPVIYTMASDIPEIKATNVAQQLGGAMTYTKRYMLMNTFDIVDNNLDFDSDASYAKRNHDLAETLKEVSKEIKECVSKDELKILWNKYSSLQNESSFKLMFREAEKQIKTTKVND